MDTTSPWPSPLRTSPRSLGSKGESQSTVARHRAALGVFKAFQDAHPESDFSRVPFNRLPEENVTTRLLYEQFAYFLTVDYTIPRGAHKGQHLDHGTSCPYLNTLLHIAQDIHDNSTNSATNLFFRCLDHGSAREEARWLSGLRNNMVRWRFNETTKNGKEHDHSAPPVYLSHIEQAIQALAKTGTPEDTSRKFAILTCWRCCGRSGEVGALTVDGMTWDDEFQCVRIEVPQWKSSKCKIVPLTAGANRHNCWFLAMGDYFAFADKRLVVGAKQESDTGQNLLQFIFPDLSPDVTHTAGKKVGSWLQALQTKDRGGLARYEKVAVRSFPVGVNAAGIRKGACISMARYMPCEYVAQMTGHDLRAVSALFEYLEAQLAATMPGAIVLAGFHALPWGHFGYGPTAPSLSILVEQEMVDKIIFEDIADDFFRLDDAAPAHYRHNGELRPAVLVALACQVMYYAERRAASEVPQVLRRLEVAVRYVHLKHNQQVNAVDVLETWGTHVKIQFDNKNMPLTMRHAEPHDTKIIMHLERLATLVSNHGFFLNTMSKDVQTLEALVRGQAQMMQQQQNMIAQMGAQMVQQHHMQQQMQHQMQQMQQQLMLVPGLYGAQAATAARPTPASPTTTPTSAHLNPAVAADPLNTVATSPSHAAAAGPSNAAATHPNLPNATQRPSNAFTNMRSPSNTETPAYPLSKSANEFYFDCMTKYQGDVPGWFGGTMGGSGTEKANQMKARTCLSFFKAMHTDEEKKTMSTPSLPLTPQEKTKLQGDQRTIAAKLTMLLASKLKYEFSRKLQGGKMPHDLEKNAWKKMLVSTIHARLTGASTKAHFKHLDKDRLDRNEFQQWRMAQS